VGRVSLERATAVGLALITAAALALLLMTSGVFGRVGLVPLAAALFVLMSSMSLVLPNAQTLGLQRAPHAAGSASALIGTSSFLIGAIASPLVGIAGEDTAVPMALVQLVSVLVAGTAYVLLCRPRAGAGAKATLTALRHDVPASTGGRTAAEVRTATGAPAPALPAPATEPTARTCREGADEG
jgi:DHA1 family bicyclomycin/chloramphenicol resistance-like MFS transporter